MTDLDKGELEACINSLGKKFLMYPYNFFTETDAHAFLFYYMFRYAKRGFKIQYPSKDEDKAVLIHREFPTVFKFTRNPMERNDKGTRGHYDLVVLNPEFMETHTMPELIAGKLEAVDSKNPVNLFAAIEFKFIKSPLGKAGKGMRLKIANDIIKLSWALEPFNDWPKQCIQAYALIFNRCRPEEDFQKELDGPEGLAAKHPKIRILYIESVPGKKKHTAIRYFQDWTHKLPSKK